MTQTSAMNRTSTMSSGCFNVQCQLSFIFRARLTCLSIIYDFYLKTLIQRWLFGVADFLDLNALSVVLAIIVSAQVSNRSKMLLI